MLLSRMNERKEGVVDPVGRELTMDERVQELKERFKKLGIAEDRTSTCADEYESLVSYLRE